VLLAAAVAGGASESGLNPDAILDQIRTGEVNLGAAVQVKDFRLRSGTATVHLIDGVLVPANNVGARPVEFVFVGEGRIESEPPDEVEAGQLELFTGSRTLDEEFNSAVFVIARDEASDGLLTLPGATGDDRLARAAGILSQWHQRPERRLLDVEARLFSDAVGNPVGEGYFCGFFEGEELGPFLYVVDPLADEQLSIGQFVRPELSRSQERRARRRLGRAQRQGKLIGLDIEDLGTWDTWVSTRLRDTGGAPYPGGTGVEPVHYQLDVSLHGDRLALEATATIDLQVSVENLRTVTLEMGQDLEPVAVSDADGQPLVFLRTRGELTVLLPKGVAAGSTTTIEVRYSGQPFDRESSGVFVQRSTTGWYPRAGRFDRATYDMTFHWPADLGLEGSGQVVESGTEGDGRNWQRRQLDTRALGVSFEVGDFEVVTGQVGHVEVRVAVDKLAREVSRDLGEEILESVQGSLAYFEGIYGPYPLDELVVVTTPRTMSQGLLGFVTLSTGAVQDWAEWGLILGFEDRRTVIAHEMAHQWWGNLVGWESYRDQWISEAMANYSALLYARNRLGSRGEAFRNGPTRGWQAALLRSMPDGRTLESIGPVVLGTRLFSSITASAYQPIVYQKGAVVLDMLARFFTEEVFLEILQKVVGAASDSLVSTEVFLTMLERLGGTDLTWFSDQYVFGTGLPDIFYDYTIRQAEDGSWIIRGEADQMAPAEYGTRIVRRPDDTLDVQRFGKMGLDVAGSVLVVPVEIGVISPGQGGDSAMEQKSRSLMTGYTMLEGESSRFRFEIEAEPEILWLDRQGEVFGRFFSTDQRPRRAAYHRGRLLAAAGRLEEAESSFLAGLAAELEAYPEAWRGLAGDVDYEGRFLDVMTRIALTRLYLDTDREDEAEKQLRRAVKNVPSADRFRLQPYLLALEARLDLRQGNAQRAYKSLRKKLMGSRGAESAEGWALLTVASHVVGRQEMFQTACARAAQFGVDLGELAVHCAYR
jgi:hypothetical protein